VCKESNPLIKRLDTFMNISSALILFITADIYVYMIFFVILD